MDLATLSFVLPSDVRDLSRSARPVLGLRPRALYAPLGEGRPGGIHALMALSAKPFERQTGTTCTAGDPRALCREREQARERHAGAEEAEKPHRFVL